MSNIELVSRQPLTFNLPRDTTLQSLIERIRSFFVPKNGSFVVKYEDEEGDWVTISTDAELREAFQLAKERSQKYLKIQVGDTENPFEFLASYDSSSITTPSQEAQDSKVSQETYSETAPAIEIKCHNCQVVIDGIRYKCGVCADFDLCPDCEALPNVHPEDHPFLKIRHPLPATFQSVHVVTATLHQCRGHLSNVQPQFNAVAEQTKANLSSFTEEVAISLQHLSEQFIQHANELKKDLVVKYDHLKNVSVSDVINEIRASVPFSMSPKNSETTTSTTSSSPVSAASVSLNKPDPSPKTKTSAPRVVTASPQLQTNSSAPRVVIAPPSQAVQNFTTQLQSLCDMGFVDTERNVTLLRKHSGEINQVISELCN